MSNKVVCQCNSVNVKPRGKFLVTYGRSGNTTPVMSIMAGLTYDQVNGVLKCIAIKQNQFLCPSIQSGVTELQICDQNPI